jgi:ankyrin repeat protein
VEEAGARENLMSRLHGMLDWDYGADELRRMLDSGADPNARAGVFSEAPLHVAARRRRCGAVTILLDHGAEIDAKNGGGKTAYAHAIRRSFLDIADILQSRGADTALNDADRLAVALGAHRYDEARALLAAHPEIARTGNPEEDRLLPDLAGHVETIPVEILIQAGADLSARGLDNGTALHQAAWFGQPQNARLLIDAGAPLDVFDDMHESSPLGWAVHGSRYSGGAEDHQDAYVELVEMLLAAGPGLEHPAGRVQYVKRLFGDASPRVRDVLRKQLGG